MKGRLEERQVRGSEEGIDPDPRSDKAEVMDWRTEKEERICCLGRGERKNIQQR